jgi:hypothetical protein
MNLMCSAVPLLLLQRIDANDVSHSEIKIASTGSTSTNKEGKESIIARSTFIQFNGELPVRCPDNSDHGWTYSIECGCCSNVSYFCCGLPCYHFCNDERGNTCEQPICDDCWVVSNEHTIRHTSICTNEYAIISVHNVSDIFQGV